MTIVFEKPLIEAAFISVIIFGVCAVVLLAIGYYYWRNM